jgi:hypothetical protein
MMRRLFWVVFTLGVGWIVLSFAAIVSQAGPARHAMTVALMRDWTLSSSLIVVVIVSFALLRFIVEGFRITVQPRKQPRP